MATTARARFSAAIAGDHPIFAPLCPDPLNARLVESLGFGAGYLSGGALGFQYAVGEALLTPTEIADAAHRITARSALPLIIDGGVGFGDPVHTARAAALFEATGAVAVEFEDQVAPKRLHHHIGIEHLVPTQEMVDKITAAVGARTDSRLPDHRPHRWLRSRGSRRRDCTTPRVSRRWRRHRDGARP